MVFFRFLGDVIALTKKRLPLIAIAFGPQFALGVLMLIEFAFGEPKIDKLLMWALVTLTAQAHAFCFWATSSEHVLFEKERQIEKQKERTKAWKRRAKKLERKRQEYRQRDDVISFGKDSFDDEECEEDVEFDEDDDYLSKKKDKV